MLENAAVTDGEMVGCSQMEIPGRALLLQSGQLLENNFGGKNVQKAPECFSPVNFDYWQKTS